MSVLFDETGLYGFLVRLNKVLSLPFYQNVMVY